MRWSWSWGQGVTAHGYNVSFGSDENALNDDDGHTVL